MHYSDLIQLYFERSNALQWYWTLYVVIVGGLLAFSSLRTRRDAITGLLVTVLFVIFAYKNLGAIHDTTVQRAAVLQAIDHYRPTSRDTDAPPANQYLESTLMVPDYDGVRTTHIASDVLTIAALWGMELRRIKYASKEATK